DRFGLLPPPTRTLFAITWLKLLAQRLGVVKIRAGGASRMLEFGERSAVDPLALVSLVEDEPEQFRLEGPYKLRFTWSLDTDAERLPALGTLRGRRGAVEAESEAA